MLWLEVISAQSKARDTIWQAGMMVRILLPDLHLYCFVIFNDRCFPSNPTKNTICIVLIAYADFDLVCALTRLDAPTWCVSRDARDSNRVLAP
jgi:hypothetical protein